MYFYYTMVNYKLNIFITNIKLLLFIHIHIFYIITVYNYYLLFKKYDVNSFRITE